MNDAHELIDTLSAALIEIGQPSLEDCSFVVDSDSELGLYLRSKNRTTLFERPLLYGNLNNLVPISIVSVCPDFDKTLAIRFESELNGIL